MDPLKLIALDGDDMQVVSAHLQDPLVRTDDIRWRPPKNGWWSPSTVSTGRWRQWRSPQFRRCRSALRFERVLSCKCRNVECADGKSEALNLLAVAFSETDFARRRGAADLLGRRGAAA